MTTEKRKVGSQPGRTFSEETRAKMSAARKGVPKTAETRAKMSAAKKGVAKSDAHKEAIRQAQKERFAKLKSPKE